MKDHNSTGFETTRRGFGAALALGLTTGWAIKGTVGMAHAAGWQDGPVVSFHNDAPYLDVSGRDRPFYPPMGAGTFVPDSESLARLGHFL